MPKGSHVIMIDDDKILVDMYKERLELAGYKVTVSNNGEEGLAKIREEKPDIILLDIMMPKVNGYDALASLKSDPQTKDIPVVILSALMRDFNREKAVEAGADDYLIKSEAMPADVITKIEQVLQKYGKGTIPAPGMNPSNIPTSTATPPSKPPLAPLAPPASPPAPPPPTAGTPKAVSATISSPPDLSSVTPSISKPEKPQPEKIIFEPASPSQGGPANPDKKPDTIETEPIGYSEKKSPIASPLKEEKTPVVTFSHPKPSDSKQAPFITSAKSKSPASIALIIILTILLTALINDLVIYFFFFAKK